MNDDQNIERKVKTIRDLKQFARAEMARDLAKRHGKSLSLPWDPEEQPQEMQAEPQSPELDSESLEALAGMAGGN
jgi:hypothetical protein